MDITGITEQERSEILAALKDRREGLEKLQKDTVKKNVPTDYIDMRLALYSSRDVPDGRGGVRMEAGLLAMFAEQATLTDEQRAMERDRDARGDRVDHAPDLFGGGAETGGGAPAGERMSIDEWNQRQRGGVAGKAVFDPNEPAEMDDEIGTHHVGGDPRATMTTAPRHRLLGAGAPADGVMDIDQGDEAP